MKVGNHLLLLKIMSQDGELTRQLKVHASLAEDTI